MTRRRTRPPADPARAVAYIRVSTKEQDYGPDAQRADIEAYAREHGLNVVATCEERVSTRKPIDQRHELVAAFGALRAHGAGTLLVGRRDRLSRDVVEMGTLERLAADAGATIQSCDGLGNGDGPGDALVRHVVAALGAYQRAYISITTKAGLRARRARGLVTGSVPFGYTRHGERLAPHPEEQAALARMKELYSYGSTYREIARALTDEGHSPRKKKWYPGTIQRLLRGVVEPEAASA